MTNTNRIQLAAAAALLAAAPVAASAQQTAYTTQPVAIQSVSADDNIVTLPYAGQRYFNGLSVSFVNTTNVAAKNVAFAVTRDGKTEIVSEAGTFAPNARIESRLAQSLDTLPAADATVRIAKVDFADGSTWTPEAGRVAQR
jgi:hypothetical protein